jgi:ATP-dependent Clp protease adapter protein ClpS
VNGVEILNDDQTPMAFVVDALSAHMHLTKSDAVKAMLQIHSRGGMLLPTPTYELAKAIVEALQADAAKHGHSFSCRAVSRTPGVAR